MYQNRRPQGRLTYWIGRALGALLVLALVFTVLVLLWVGMRALVSWAF